MIVNSKPCKDCSGCRVAVRIEIPALKSLSTEETLLVEDISTILSIVLAINGNTKIATFLSGCILKAFMLVEETGMLLGVTGLKSEVREDAKENKNENKNLPPHIP